VRQGSFALLPLAGAHYPEPVQLAYFLATAFSQVGLFLDEAFFCGYILHITVNHAIASIGY